MTSLLKISFLGMERWNTHLFKRKMSVLSQELSPWRGTNAFCNVSPSLKKSWQLENQQSKQKARLKTIPLHVNSLLPGKSWREERDNQTHSSLLQILIHAIYLTMSSLKNIQCLNYFFFQLIEGVNKQVGCIFMQLQMGTCFQEALACLKWLGDL